MYSIQGCVNVAVCSDSGCNFQMPPGVRCKFLGRRSSCNHNHKESKGCGMNHRRISLAGSSLNAEPFDGLVSKLRTVTAGPLLTQLQCFYYLFIYFGPKQVIKNFLGLRFSFHSLWLSLFFKIRLKVYRWCRQLSKQAVQPAFFLLFLV